MLVHLESNPFGSFVSQQASATCPTVPSARQSALGGDPWRQYIVLIASRKSASLCSTEGEMVVPCKKWGLPTDTIAEKADMATALIVEQWKKMITA